MSLARKIGDGKTARWIWDSFARRSEISFNTSGCV